MVHATAAEPALGPGRNPPGTPQDLAALLHDVREATGADGVALILREADTCHYAEEDAVGPLWKGQRFPMRLCISGWCMLHRETATVEDIYRDARIPHDAYRPTFVRSLIMTPLGGETPFAALGAYWREMRSFGGRDVIAIETLGERVARALTP
jgi:hypothetical protein